MPSFPLSCLVQGTFQESACYLIDTVLIAQISLLNLTCFFFCKAPFFSSNASYLPGLGFSLLNAGPGSKMLQPGKDCDQLLFSHFEHRERKVTLDLQEMHFYCYLHIPFHLSLSLSLWCLLSLKRVLLLWREREYCLSWKYRFLSQNHGAASRVYTLTFSLPFQRI